MHWAPRRSYISVCAFSASVSCLRLLGGGEVVGAAGPSELARRSGHSRADRWPCGPTVRGSPWQEDGDGGSLMWQKQSRCLVRLRATRGAQTQTHNTAFLCAALAAATRLPQPGLSLRSLHVHRSKSLLDRCPASWGKALLQPQS